MVTESFARSPFPGPNLRHGSRVGVIASASTLGRILWRHKLFLFCLMLTALTLAFVHVSQVPAVFEAETLILLDQREGHAEPGGPITVPLQEAGPQSETLALRSPAMAARLVEALGLHLLPEFNPSLRAETGMLRDWFDPAKLVPNSLFNRLPVVLREALSTQPAMSDEQEARSLRAEIAERTLTHIVAEPADRPSVIRVRFVANDPRLAAMGANTLADRYLVDRLAARQAVSTRAGGFLREEIARLRAKIAQASLESMAAHVARSSAAGVSAAAGPSASETIEADHDLLATYTARLQEIASLQEAQEPGARVIALANLPEEAINPRRKLTFGVALFGALVVGSLAALGLERLDNTVSSAGQLEQLKLPTLGALPSVPAMQGPAGAPERHILDYPHGAFAEAVAALRNELVRASVAGHRKTVLFASAVAGEGTSTTALCLARCHARAGGRVLLIDCDLRAPRLHQLTSAPDQPGLTDVLLGHQSLDQVARLDERSGAWLVTAGTGVPDPRALLASDATRKLMRHATQSHDLVILDGPPVLGSQDACGLAQIADSTVLLARWGSTRRQDVIAAARFLTDAGADMRGLVLSRSRSARFA
jgi:capsular exopolysaccharide synthesis family protein